MILNNRIVLFICSSILILIGINKIVTLIGKDFKDGASIICESKREAVRSGTLHYDTNEIKVIFLGASDILSGIIPSIFDSLSNNRISSVNLALPALPIGPNYFCLLDYLEKNSPPDYAIITLRLDDPSDRALFDFYANQGIAFPRELLSYAIIRKDRNVILNYLLPCNMYSSVLLKSLKTILLSRSEIRNIRKRNSMLVEQMIEEKGYYFIKEQGKFPDGILPDIYTNPDDAPDQYRPVGDLEDPYLHKFLKFTQQQQIEVLITNYPLRVNSNKPFERIPNELTNMCLEYPHVTLLTKSWISDPYPNKLFSDPKHLNMDGAKHYTTQVYKEFEGTVKDFR
ncbi:hypothetical protein ACFLR8_02985 [Bacteroidota bacterium]